MFLYEQALMEKTADKIVQQTYLSLIFTFKPGQSLSKNLQFHCNFIAISLKLSAHFESPMGINNFRVINIQASLAPVLKFFETEDQSFVLKGAKLLMGRPR